MKEFDLIDKFFTARSKKSSKVKVGIGDDCAILKTSINNELAVTTDTLVSGVHFHQDINAYDLGYKSLAVNLSDLAASGAKPCWATLALTLPAAKTSWLKAFADGFFELLDKYKMTLIGGDLTHGPLSVTITAFGTVPTGKAILRSGANPGDTIYVTGPLGNAGLALQKLAKHSKLSPELHTALFHPTPRIEEGIALRKSASAMIDISDGLAADLGHILQLSNVGAEIYLDKLPLTKELKRLPADEAWNLALTAGDDYELCFTSKKKKITPYYQIGVITKEPELKIINPTNQQLILKNSGYEHIW